MIRLLGPPYDAASRKGRFTSVRNPLRSHARKIAGILVLLLRSAVVFLLLFPQPIRADDEAEQRLERAIDRANQEAATLIQNVLRDHVPDQQPCIFAKQWSSRAVYVTLAQQYLGLSFYADVSAPHTGTAPSDIIDPAGLTRGHFCSEAEANEMWSQRLDNLRRGAPPADTEQRYQQPAISIRRVDISMPVFDAGYSTAIVVVSSMERSARVQFDKVKQSIPAGFGQSFVYRKESGEWALIHSTLDYTAN